MVLEPEDRKKRAALQMLSTIRADKTLKRDIKQREKNTQKRAESDRVERKFEDIHKMEKKKRYRDEAKDKTRMEAKRHKKH